jgi:predicted ATPase
MLYETAAGQLPFEGQTATDVLATILHREPPPLRLRRHDAPAELERIVEKALAKDREERYQTAKDLAADLRRLRQRLDVEAEIERMRAPEESKARPGRERQDARALARSKPESQESTSIGTASSSENLPPHNLSAELSPLIGRKAELTEIAEMLRQAEIRLLTITGVGGTGKTRLAQAVAHQALAAFADGVYFIDLSAIESAELVVPIIAQTLGVHEEGGKPLVERLREHLRGRKVLLVLDNFEQITRAAPRVGELLSGSVNLKILVTSRVRLNLRFEHEFPLQPLAVPAQGRLILSELRGNPAIALFVERAQAVKPAFTLTEENVQAAADICRRLDGLPLAIELAAARVKLLAPQAILTRLSNSLKLLTGGARDLPERQQTMRAAIKWSYDLLDAEEQKLLNRLAVFGGGFTLDAAEKVANSGADLEIDSFDGIASLVDKSLLSQSEQADGEPRFRMLVVVREFALEELGAGGGAEEVKKRHAEYYARMAESAEPELLGGKAGEWLETLEQEHDNLRLALEWGLGREPQTALRIVGAIEHFWYKRGYFSEGSEWTRAALERNGEEADTKLQAKAYLGISQLIWCQGDLESAEQFAQEGLRLARKVGEKSLICIALGYLGVIKRQQGGELCQAKVFSEEALALARELKDKRLISTTLNSLGEIARHQEDYEAAREFYEEALTLARQESANHFISISTQNLAMISCFRGDDKAALSYTLESLEISEELGGKINVGIALQIFASLAVVAGETEKAARLFGAGQAIHNAAGYKLEEVDQKFVDRYVGEACARMGDEAFEAAFQEGKQMRMKKAIELARETG